MRRLDLPVDQVMRARGAYCWMCGQDAWLLAQNGIPMEGHHTRPSWHPEAEAAEEIPLCKHCHELATLQQRHHRALLRGDAITEMVLEAFES